MIAKNPQGQNAAANAPNDQSHGPNAKRVRLAPPHPGNNSGGGPPDFHGQHVGQQPHVQQHPSTQQQQQQQQQQQHASQSGNSNHGHGHHPQHPSQQGNMQGGMHPNYSNHPQQQSHPQQNSFNQRF